MFCFFTLRFLCILILLDVCNKKCLYDTSSTLLNTEQIFFCHWDIWGKIYNSFSFIYNSQSLIVYVPKSGIIDFMIFFFKGKFTVN